MSQHVQLNHVVEKKKYQINPDYILRQIGGEYAIIPVGTECLISNAVMTPNESAVFLWKAFQQPSTEDDVVKKVMQEYDGVPEIIRRDVHCFLVQAYNCQILREV